MTDGGGGRILSVRSQDEDRRNGVALLLAEAWSLIMMGLKCGPLAWFGLSAAVMTALTIVVSLWIHSGFGWLVKREFPEANWPRNRVLAIPAIVGLFERSTLTLAIYFVATSPNPGTAADAIKSLGPCAFAWIGLKMAAGWHRGNVGGTTAKVVVARCQGFAGLLGSLISLGLACIAGIVMAHERLALASTGNP